jgi:putative glutathione S-transferase
VTVPVLWDKRSGTIVSNESSEIIRMLAAPSTASARRPVTTTRTAPAGDRRDQRARLRHVNNGVYKAGFATSQAAYEEAVGPLFETLEWLDTRLADRRFLLGDALTEADIRLFTTLVRFDPVYVGHFKCNLRRLVDLPNLWAYTRDLYALPGVAGR